MKQLFETVKEWIEDNPFKTAIIVIIILIPIRNFLAWRDVDQLKIDAPAFVTARGYSITSYDGYEGDVIHGGFVWYQATDSNGYRYQFSVGDWRGDLMMYEVKCLNAVQNSK